MSEKPIDIAVKNGMVCEQLHQREPYDFGQSNFYEIAAKCLNLRESGIPREEIRRIIAKDLQRIPQSFIDVWDMSFSIENARDIARNALESTEKIMRTVEFLSKQPNPA